MSTVAKSHDHPYSRGLATRWEIFVAKTSTALAAVNPTTAAAAADRIGTEARPRPATNAMRSPLEIVGGSPAALAASATREVRAPFVTVVVVLADDVARSAATTTSAPMIATLATVPRPMTSQSA